MGFPINAAYHDTGMRTWNQPDGTKFQARTWGDEFYHWMETKNGYRIVRGDDQWFYYATLGKEGQYVASQYRVGIDAPPAESYKLERSTAWKAQRDSLVAAFESGIVQTKQEYDVKQKAALAGNPVSYTLNIVLVEFTDTTHYEDPDPESPHYNGYLKAMFDSMFFSQEHFWEDFDSELHPEGDSLFGSFRDYWTEQSFGLLQFSVNSGVVNPINPDGTPQWYQLDSTYSYYRNLGLYNSIDAIVSELDLDTLQGKVGIIYAGESDWIKLNGRYPGLWPHAHWNGKYYIAGEQSRDKKVYGGDDLLRFGHIGLHCHEFGHLLGFPDVDTLVSPYHWSLMAAGGSNGPRMNSACPASVKPSYKIDKGWVSYTDILTGVHRNFEFKYNYDNPKYYKVPVSGTNDYYILEQRLHEGFDLYTPPLENFLQNPPVPPNGTQGGLIIWRGDYFIEADNDHEAWPSDHLFTDPFPYDSQNQNFNDHTTPNSQIDGDLSHIAIQNIYWHDATKTVTADIYTNAWGGNISQNTTWSGDVYIYDGVVVDNNTTLTIEAGTTIHFGGHYNFNVKAGSRILAQGTSSEPIQFTLDPHASDDDWGTFYIRGSNNILQYCTFEKGDWGVKIIGSPDPANGNLVENCIFRWNDQGLRIHNNDIDVRSCDLYENRHAFVLIDNVQVNLEGNHVYLNERDGIYATSGNLVNLYGNVIESNGIGNELSRHGIYGYQYSGNVFNLGDVSTGDWEGYNTIRENYQVEVKADGNSGSLRNSIHDYDGYEIYNYNTYPMFPAVFTWFGEYPPDQNQWYGGVSTYGSLSSVPNWEGTTRTGALGKSATPDDQYPPLHVSPGEKINNLQAMIQAHPRSIRADSALTALYRMIRSDYVDDNYGHREQFFGYLQQVYSQHPETALGQKALRYMMFWQQVQNNLDAAIQLGQLARAEATGMERQALQENLVMLYLRNQQLTGAETALARYQAAFPNATGRIAFLSESIAQYRDMQGASQGLVKPHAPQNGQTPGIPTELVLQQNYPNPFNPATTIAFGLPADQHVQIIIYNVRGHQVATVLNTMIQKGYHAVRWDGRNTGGERVASGLYIYQIRTSQSMISKKLMLLR